MDNSFGEGKMNDIVRYVTYSSDNADENYKWLCYVVLPNGDYWGVRFSDATEEIARTKAISTWNSEREKWAKREPDLLTDAFQVAAGNNDPWAPKQHHLANKVWMRHKEARNLIRVPLTEITMYEAKGYERSGPRSK